MVIIMLDKNGTRQLAYVVVVDTVTPIEGYDRVELAHVGGWTVVVGKNEFHAGDPAIYFEIDSKLPEVEPFINMEFLAKKHYKIKTQKMCRVLSQGLLMSAANFGWQIIEGDNCAIVDNEGNYHRVDDESRFLTKQLGITYAVAEDNKRKASNNPNAKINSALARHPKIAKKYGKFIKNHKFIKWLFLLMYDNRRDKKSDWPAWVKKTDEERIENLPFLFNDKSDWIATEKIDGSSCTFALKRGHGLHKDEFYVCSRNVVFNKPDKPCYYDTNIYFEIAEKYDIFNKMTDLLHNHFTDCEWITIQGEIYGQKVQRRDYHMNERKFMAFNFITSKEGRWNSVLMKDLIEKNYGIPCVPILNEHYILPDTIEELRAYVDSQTSTIDGDIREGIVFRSQDGSRSFKCVSPTYLITYHI